MTENDMEISDWRLFLVGAGTRLPSARNVTCATSDRPKPIYNTIPWAPAPLFRALLAPRSYPPCAGLFFVPRSCRQVVIRTKSRKAQRLVEVAQALSPRVSTVDHDRVSK